MFAVLDQALISFNQMVLLIKTKTGSNLHNLSQVSIYISAHAEFLKKCYSDQPE